MRPPASGPAPRRLAGNGGALRVVYQRAARLASWTLVVAADGRGQLEAVVVDAHAHWLGQRPMDLVLRVADAEWHWEDVDPVVSGAAVTVALAGRPHVVSVAEAPERAWTVAHREQT